MKKLLSLAITLILVLSVASGTYVTVFAAEEAQTTKRLNKWSNNGQVAISNLSGNNAIVAYDYLPSAKGMTIVYACGKNKAGKAVDGKLVHCQLLNCG